jgi:hypothetical protein
MAFTVSSKGGGDFEPIPVGVHKAICVWVVDLGSTYSERFAKWTRQVLITWELPEERIDIEKDGKKQNLPRVISKTYTSSISPKANLRHDLCSWRGREFTPEEEKAFEFSKLLGAPAQLNVMHRQKDGNTYANVAAIIPGPKGWKPQSETPSCMYYIDDDGTAIPEELPEWIQNRIKDSQEFKALTGNDESSVGQSDEPYYDDSDLPF